MSNHISYAVANLRPFICLSCVAGSKAYGLETSTSDDDYKGVYLARLEDVLTGRAPKVVQDDKHDVQYTELGEFLHQLQLNNSGALELWACMGQRQQLYCAGWFSRFFAGRRPLSKLCAKTYIGNARSQLKRICSTHEKATTPPPEFKTLACFARVLNAGESAPLDEWLACKGMSMVDITAKPVQQGVWALYRQANPAGLFGRDGNNVTCPLIRDESPFLAYMQVDSAAFHAHSLVLAQYREWKEKRNETRLRTVDELPADEGNYDTKHMVHVLRLLHTAREIATEGCIHVLRTHDKELLRDIRQGRIPLSEAYQHAQQEITAVEHLFNESTLPDTPQLGDWEYDLARLRIQRHHEHANH